MSRVDLGPLLEELRTELTGRTRDRRRALRLGVLVERGNVPGGSFARSLEKEAQLAGIAVEHRVAEPDAPEQTLILLDELVVDPTIAGVVVVQPVRSLPTAVVAAHLPASKDVEAITPAALAAAAAGVRRGTPVAEACLATLVHLGVDLEQAAILVVGHGPTGGRPIAQRLLAAGAQLTVVQRQVDALDPLPNYQVLISAVGQAGVIPASVIHPGTTVLDVGTSMVANQLRGDLSPEAALRAGRYTPVPGGVGRITSVCALLSLTELASIPPGPVASWSLLEAVARLLSPRDPAGGAAAAAITGALAAALDGLCRMHRDPAEIAGSGQTAVRLLLAADRDRAAFGEYQRAQRSASVDLEARRLAALATPAEIAAQLNTLELRLRELTTTPALELDRRLAEEIAGAAREAVLRLLQEFSQQS